MSLVLLCVLSACSLADLNHIYIVITVRTDVSIVEQCINALERHYPNRNIFHQSVIFVDDGSPAATLSYQAKLCEDKSKYICLETQEPQRGYTFAVNKGIRYAVSQSHTKAVVILNSDTYVTETWLETLYNALYDTSDLKLMAVGPISNAATWQSVPSVSNKDTNNEINLSSGWSTNPLPLGLDIDNFASIVRRTARDLDMKPMQLDILNGFCFMLKPEVFLAVGYFDEENFPRGYGEEVDFFVRINKAGYGAKVVPTAYVYHIKTASFSENEKAKLKKGANSHLKNKYSNFLDKFQGRALTLPLGHLRRVLRDVYKSYTSQYTVPGPQASILFVMHDVVIGGGSISVLQEALGMHRLGVDVAVSLPRRAGDGDPIDMILEMFPHVTRQEVQAVTKFHRGKASYPHRISSELVGIARQYDIVVATFCMTASATTAITTMFTKIMPAYYVQDYEPWFITSPFAKPSKRINRDAYRYINSTYGDAKNHPFMFSKTQWLVDTVYEHHQAPVMKVVPSIDHLIYYPDSTELSSKWEKTFESGKFEVIAMIRPRTDRRNAEGTLDTLLRLVYTYPERVHITVFGSGVNSVKDVVGDIIRLYGAAPHRSMELLKDESRVTIAEKISGRTELADLYRRSDVFVDMSWWQAFGRSGAEAMACGCIPIMPLHGAGAELCEDGKSCLFMDGQDRDAVFNAIVSLLHDRDRRRELIRNGIDRTYRFSIIEAGASINAALQRAYREFRSHL